MTTQPVDKVSQSENVNVKSLSKGIKFKLEDFETFKPLLSAISKLKKVEKSFFEEIQDKKDIEKYKTAISLLLSFNPSVFKNVLQEYRKINKKAKENFQDMKGKNVLEFIKNNPDRFKDIDEVKDFLQVTGVEIETKKKFSGKTKKDKKSERLNEIKEKSEDEA